VFVLIASIGWAAVAYAQDGPNQRPSDYAPIALSVACGGQLRSACGKVVPRIATQTAKAGVLLKPVGSGLAVDTAAAVCDGQTAAAIAQHDAVALIARQPACLGRYDFVGRPLYPYYAFLVVKAGAPFRQFNDMANDGRRHVIMAGAEGTSGQITLGFLLRSNPFMQRSVVAALGDLDIGLERVANGSIDGFFALESLDSDMIDRVRLKADAHGKPLYAFLDIYPPPEFFRMGDGGGHCLYRLTALDFGGAAPVTTVSVDAVMVLSRAFRDSHARGGPRASDALTSAIDAAEPAILADMRTQGDWRPVATSCQ
jgi:hypothetical protein